MKIGLLGFAIDDANKGCEALTYSFLSMLEEIIPGNNKYFFYFAGSNLVKIKDYFSTLDIYAPRVRIKDIRLSALREFVSCDVLFDITSGDGFSDIYFASQVRNTMNVKAFAEMLNKKLVLLPQTYGPFSDAEIKKRAMKIIKKASRVYSRDMLSTKYVQENINKEIIETTDLAFALPYRKADIKSKNEKICIGLNISGLLWRGGFEKENQFGLKFAYKDYIERLINQICNNPRYELHIIPHVIESETDNIDGDVAICKMVSQTHSGVIFSGGFENPIQAKNYISAMDIFIGARMHSTIAAFSSYVATIPFSYSRKFEGLYSSLGYEYVIKSREWDLETALKTTQSWVEDYHALQKCSSSIMTKVNASIENFKIDLNGFLNT